MQKAQLYIGTTPGGNYKAYALGYPKSYDGDPNNNDYYYKPAPNQPLRGYKTPQEVSEYISKQFSNSFVKFDEWAQEKAGNGSPLDAGENSPLKSRTTEGWQVFPWPNNPTTVKTNTHTTSAKGDDMPRRKNKKSVEIDDDDDDGDIDEIQNADIEYEDEYEDEENVAYEPEPKPRKTQRRKRRVNRTNKNNINAQLQPQMMQPQPMTPTPGGMFPGFGMQQQNPFAIQPQNRITHEQYRQIVEGVTEIFENTLMTAMSHNYALNSATMVHAYRALKLMNVLQFMPALEAVNIAATHDITWVSFRDSIIQANRMVGWNI